MAVRVPELRAAAALEVHRRVPEQRRQRMQVRRLPPTAHRHRPSPRPPPTAHPTTNRAPPPLQSALQRALPSLLYAACNPQAAPVGEADAIGALLRALLARVDALRRRPQLGAAAARDPWAARQPLAGSPSWERVRVR